MNEGYVEIDLRPLIAEVLKQWKLIAAVTFAFALVAIVISSLLPKSYESTVLIAVPKERLRVQVESNALSINEPALNDGAFASDYATLAMSDGVLLKLSERLISDGLEYDVVQLQRALSAENSRGSEIIQLMVTAESPDEAAVIANSWADLYIVESDSFYQNTAVDDLSQYEAELAEAKDLLQQLDEEMVAFQATNRFHIVQNRLDEARSQLSSDLVRLSRLDRRADEAASLLAQVSNSTEATLAVELHILQLQLNSDSATSGASLQVTDISGIDVSSVSQQQTQITNLITSLESEQALVTSRLTDLEAEILLLQNEFTELQTIQESMDRQNRSATAYVNSLNETVNGIRVTTGNSVNAQLKTISNAIPNATPTGPRLLFNVALATMIGLIGSIVYLATRVWWQSKAVTPALTSVEPTGREIRDERQLDGNRMPQPISSD